MNVSIPADARFGRRIRSSAFTATTAMAAALACVVAAERARAQAADACGTVASDGAVRCTAGANPYRHGISYHSSSDLMVALDEDVAVELGRNRSASAAVRLIGRSDASVALHADQGSSVRTVGAGQAGLRARSESGGIEIVAPTIVTRGEDSAGIIARSTAGGDISIAATSVRTHGDGSRGIVARTPQGGDIDISSGLVRTTGADSTAILARSPLGSIRVTAADIRTLGDYSNGVDAVGETIRIAIGGAVTTSGVSAVAISADAGGRAEIHVQDAITTGFGGAAVEAWGTSVDVTIDGTAASRGGAEFGALGSTLWLDGSADAAGLGGDVRLSNNGRVVARGDNNGGVIAQADGGLVIQGGGSFATHGANSTAIDAWANRDLSIDIGPVRTTGDNSIGIAAVSAGKAHVQVESVETLGAGSIGIRVTAQDELAFQAGRISTTGTNATGVQLTATGDDAAIRASVDEIHTAGERSFGINLVGGQSLDAAVSVGDIITTGDRSSGIRIARSNGGDMDLSIQVGSISTSGTIADGITLLTDNSGRAMIHAGNLEVAGVQAAGIYASGVGLDLDVTVGSALATGPASAGIYASGKNVTLRTSGAIESGGEEGRGISVISSQSARLTIDGDVMARGDRSVAVGVLGTAEGNVTTVDMTANIVTDGYFTTGFSAGGQGSVVANLRDVTVGGGLISAYAAIATMSGDVDLTLRDVRVGGHAVDTTYVRSHEGSASVTVTGSYRTESAGGISVEALGLSAVSVNDMDIAGENVYAILASGGDARVVIGGTIDDRVRAATGGIGGPAVYAFAGGGPLAGHASAENGGRINTFADDRGGIQIRALGNASLTGDGSVHTRGAGAAAVTMSALTGDILLRQGEILTEGDFSTGAAIIGSSADVLVDVDRVATQGHFARGIDIFSTGRILLDIGSIETSGGQSVGLRASTAGVIAGALGSLSTMGDHSSALQLTAEGGIDIASAGRISTAGHRASGIVASTSGNLSIAARDVGTLGTQSHGLSAEAGGDALLRLGTISTKGDEAGGVSLAAGGAVDIELADVVTAGEGANGIDIRADGAVRAVVGSISVGGAKARGIAIASDDSIALVVGDLDMSGPGAVGVDLASHGAGDVAAVASSIRVSDGAGIAVFAAEGVAAVYAGGIEQASSTGAGAIAVDGAAGSLVHFGEVVSVGGIPVDDASAAISAISESGDVELAGGGVSATGGRRHAILARSGGGDVLVDVDHVVTNGALAHGADIFAAGRAFLAVRSIETSGEESVGLGVLASGGIGAALGSVSTVGDRSAAVRLATEGDIAIVAEGRISTAGDGASGIAASASGDLSIAVHDIGTKGALSHGLVAEVGRDALLRHATIVTEGAGADGINLVSGGTADIVLASLVTSGESADGIDVRAGGAVRAIIGSVRVSGANARAIAMASEDSITLVTEGEVRAADDAITLSSGAGASLVNHGAIVAGGVAIRAAGGPATIVNTGSLAGAIILGDAADLVTNSGSMVLAESRFGDGDDRLVNAGSLILAGNLDFGGGSDSLTNEGILSLRASPGAGSGLRSLAAGPLTRSIAGLERVDNSGVVDLRNGVPGDTLAISGRFAGSGASLVLLDVRFGDAPAADRLDIEGVASGSTRIAINPLDAPTAFEPGIVLVTAGAGTAASAFQLVAPSGAGFFTPGLVFDAGTASIRLVTAPSGSAYRLLKISEGARSAWLESSDIVAAHLASGQGKGLWLAAGGAVNDRDQTGRFEAFGFAQDVDLGYRQDSFSTQLGYGLERGSLTFGVTAGYGSSVLSFGRSADRMEYDAVNGGLYAALRSGRFRLNALAKYDRYDIALSMPSMGETAVTNGSAFGARVEAGVRVGSAGFHAEPRASLSYQRVSIDPLALSAATHFDDRDGGRGTIGLRVAATRPIGAATLNLYAEADYVKALGDGARLVFATGATTLEARDAALPDHGAAKLGLEVTTARVSGFIEALARYGEAYRGGGARAGVRFAF